MGRRRLVVYGHHHVTAHGVTRACAGDRHEPFKQWLRLTSGPDSISYFQRFLVTQSLKFKSVSFPLSKIHQIL
jgi:hypothetical protein